MPFLNETGIIGTILISATNNITGSLFLTLLLLVIIIMVIAALFRLSLEWTAILIMPLLIVLMSYEGLFLPVGGVFLLYLAVLLGKNFFFK
jgi:hypothetical protein